MPHARVIGFVLLIAGCPYVFTTGGLVAAASTDALWFGSETGTQVADGWLHWPDFQVAERARPLDGDCDVDPVTFKLHDAKIDLGPAAGQNLFTWLATQDTTNIPYGFLTADVADELDTTWPVTDGALYAIGAFAWCEQECVRILNIVGNTLTVVRGALGTKATRHTVDTDAGVTPAVYTRLPWMARRLVTWWAVQHDGTARLVWQGMAGDSPDLSADGCTFELPCEPLWTAVKESVAGRARGTVELTGINASPEFALAAAFRFSDDAGTEYRVGGSTRQRWPSFETAAQSMVDRALSALNDSARITDAQGFFRRQGAGGVFTFDWKWDTVTGTPRGEECVLSGPPQPGERTGRTYTGENHERDNTRHAVSFYLERVPRVAYRLQFTGTQGTFGHRSARSFDRFYTVPGGTPPGGRSLSVSRALKITYSDDWDIMFYGVTHDTDYFTATPALVPRKAGLFMPSAEEAWWLVDPQPLTVVTEIQAEHWADGFRYAILPQLPHVTENHWDWTHYETLIDRTRGANAGRNWALDGTRPLGALLSEACMLAGCSVGVRAGRLALVPWQLPNAAEAPAASFTTLDLVSKITPFGVWKEGFANSLHLKSQTLTIDIENEQSVREHGPGRSISVDMSGVDIARLRSLQPGEMYRQLMGRLLLWGSPLHVVRIETGLSRMFDVYMGDTLELTEWVVPNGAGGRGLSAARCLVLGRRLDFQANKLVLEALVFRRQARGYAPCVKARQAVAPSSTQVQVDVEYIQVADDYAGSAATTNDGGVSYFRAGQKVRAVLRDSTTAFYESLQLASNPTYDGAWWRLTFTGSMSGTLQAHLASGWVDFTLDDYAGADTTDRNFAWCADESSLTIGGTSDPPHQIAP
jgi:hypothetical protein